MTLAELMAGVKFRREGSPAEEVPAEIEVTGLDYDSRRIRNGFAFFAFAGAQVDGRKYAQDAVASGAVAVISDLARPENFSAVPWLQVDHGRHAMAIAAGNFFHHPDRRMAFTGITGTNGKTTTAFLIESILHAGGSITGLLGTIEYRIAGEVLPAPNTTPESLDILRFAAELEQAGGSHLISEVSSHALAFGRVYGLHFHTAVFTNLTRDHLDFHGSMEAYGAAKRLLFEPESGPGPQWAVVNLDDPWTVAGRFAGSRVLTYGEAPAADLRAENVQFGFDGLRFDLVYRGARQRIQSPLAGRVNVMNILAAAGAGISYGLSLETIARGIAACRAVPGRFERVDQGQPFLVVVDYAHTDDALRNAIQIARQMTRGRVITVFGCGGDRDRTKRPLMGMAAGELSDVVVLTSDNPRSEDPIAIMNDVLVGLRRYDTPHSVEPDRAKAIRLALGEAAAGDVVLIAGKGHEQYQIFKDRTVTFDDRETAREALRSLGYGKAGV
jgi:UDP-N-acetylmuramoyl-L-alanyl-D-glutamate--2,6-diaminopimelate ligase